MPKTIAILGKGGVGKTTVSACLVKAIAESGKARVLAIDADPAGSLGLALAISPDRTVNDVRVDIIESIKATSTNKTDLAASLDYRLWEALSERGNIAFLSVGRPEEEGCYCQLNTLLREAIEGLAGGFDAIIIDAEAGIEQVNRRVMRSVDAVLLVTDTSLKGLNVAASIGTVVQEAVDTKDVMLIANKVRDGAELEAMKLHSEIKIFAWIPEDDTVRQFDNEGLSFLDLPSCPAFQAIEQQIVSAIFNGGGPA